MIILTILSAIGFICIGAWKGIKNRLATEPGVSAPKVKVVDDLMKIFSNIVYFVWASLMISLIIKLIYYS